MKKILSIVTVMAVTLSAGFISAFSSVLSAAEEVPFKSLYTFTLADTDLGYELRGLAASQDGEYLYAGFLQNTRNVLKIDAADGSIVDAYTPAIPEISLDIDRYPKGLATDDRGNLFVGITHAENGNNHMLTLAAVRQSDMTEISYITDTVAETDIYAMRQSVTAIIPYAAMTLPIPRTSRFTAASRPTGFFQRDFRPIISPRTVWATYT